jgi:Ni/Co efflux regulator RcnB
MKKLVFTVILVTLISFATFAQFSSYPSVKSSSRSNSSSSGLYSTPTQANSDTRQQDGYYRSNGTYVQPHVKTESNSTNTDNFSTQGNTNPYTQERGMRARDYSSESSNYGQGKQIQTGERGGQYYINNNGNKTYVPKKK